MAVLQSLSSNHAVSGGFRSPHPRFRLSPPQPPQVTHYKSSPTQHHQGLALSYFASVIKGFSISLDLLPQVDVALYAIHTQINLL
ncbi:hypothetical protein Hanom_Chr00s000251g01630231 [Helianthus anomalus]